MTDANFAKQSHFGVQTRIPQALHERAVAKVPHVSLDGTMRLTASAADPDGLAAAFNLQLGGDDVDASVECSCQAAADLHFFRWM